MTTLSHRPNEGTHEFFRRCDQAGAWEEGWRAAWTPLSPANRDEGPNPYMDDNERLRERVRDVIAGVLGDYAEITVRNRTDVRESLVGSLMGILPPASDEPNHG